MIVLTAAITGLRQSELIGLRWRDVDWGAQRIRVRRPLVRGGVASDGKTDLSTRRSVPMADWLVAELDAWSQRTRFTGESDLVFAHPVLGLPLDGSKVSKRFKQACRDAGVRVVRFHEYADVLVMPTSLRRSCSGRFRVSGGRHIQSASRKASSASVGW
jgi:integrase